MAKTNLLRAALAFALAIAGCSVDQVKKKKANQTVPVIELKNADTLLSRSYVANIEAVRNVEVRARISGYLERIFVDEGQHVRKGDLLFRLDPKEFDIAVEQAKSNVDAAMAKESIARIERQRVQGLVSKKVVSGSELELSDARLRSAQAAVRQAAALKAEAVNRRSYAEIRAPFTGVIDRIPLKTGSLINDGTLLTTISDNSTVYAYFNVSENEYLRTLKDSKASLRNGYAVQLMLADGSLHPVMGLIETQSGELNNHTGSLTFRARFENPQFSLKHGSSGKVNITSLVPAAVIIPQKAVFEVQDKCYVYLVDRDNKVKMQAFVPAVRFAESYIVKSGLCAGDRLVCEGIQNLQDGTVITPDTAVHR